MPSSGAAKNTGGTPDPNQPSPRAMHFIKNRNNMNELQLRRQLDKFSREKAVSMYNIDHARLDVKDFLKDVKHCASDNLPESKIWLGEKEDDKKKKEKEKKELQRTQTAPGSGAKNHAGERDIQTAPDPGTQKTDEMVKFGIFFKKRADLDPNKVHRDIYSKRNMYSSIDRDIKKEDSEEEKQKAEQQAKWNEEQERLKEEEAKKAEEKRREEHAIKKREEEAHQRLLERQRREMLQAERENQEENPLVDIRAEMRKIAKVREPTELEKREARIRNMNANADLMKDILMKNAKKRAQRKKKRLVPVEDRIREFFSKIEVLRKQEEEEADTGPTVEQQRRFILMTKGVKAALEFGAKDLEDYDKHTG